VTYDTVTKSFTLPDEQAFPSAVPDSPAYLPGAFHIISAVIKDESGARTLWECAGLRARKMFRGLQKVSLNRPGMGASCRTDLACWFDCNLVIAYLIFFATP
jgi:hypothetical protein